MRSSALLRLTLLASALAGAVVFGVLLFGSYWGEMRRATAYGMTREAAALAGEERVAALEDALAVDQSNWLAALRLAEEHLFANRLQEAERLLDLAVRGNPESPLANYVMGVVQYRLGAVETALPYFEAAARLDPGNLQYEGMVKQVRESLLGGGEGSPGSPDPPGSQQSPGQFHGGGTQGPDDGTSGTPSGTSTTGAPGEVSPETTSP